MSFLALTLSSLVLMQPVPPSKTVISQGHGLQFEIPRTWQEARRRDVWVWRIPTSAGVATLELYATNYRRPPAEWQRIQAQVNKDLGRTVDRQWEEVLLGVPLLLTEVSYAQRKLLIGVLYSASKGKFHFRLDAPAEGYSESEQGWRGVLNTLRPTGSELPKADDGVVPVEAPKPVVPEPVRFTPGMVQVNQQRGRYATTTANREITFRFPTDWTITAEGQGLVIKHRDLSRPAQIEFQSRIDSPEAGVAAMTRANEDLKRFEKVDLRENIGPKLNKTRANIFAITRQGKTATGLLNTWIGVGDVNGFYWKIMFESDSTAAVFQRDRRLLSQLLNEAGLEVPQ